MRALVRLFLAAALVLPQPVLALDPGKVPPITLGTGSTGDVSGMSVIPSPGAASGTLARALADQATAVAAKAPLASPTFSGTASVPVLTLTGAGSSGAVDGMSVTPLGRGASSTLSRLFDSSMSLASFGAKDDNATDNTAAVQAAVNSASALGRTLVVSASTGGTGIFRMSPSIDWKNVSLRLDNSVSFANVDGSPYTGKFSGNTQFDQAVLVGSGRMGQQGRKIELPGQIYNYSNTLGNSQQPTFSAFRLFDGQPTPPSNSAYYGMGPAYYGYVGWGSSGTPSAGSGGIFGGQMNIFRANNGNGVNINCTLTAGSIYATNCNSTAGVFDPAKITSTTAGIPINTYLDVSGNHPGVTGTIALDTTYTGTTMENVALSVNGSQFVGSLFTNSPYIDYATDVSKVTVGAAVTRVSDGFVVGKVIVPANMDRIKMSAAYTGASTSFQGATLNVVSGRGEITPFTYGVSLSKDYNMPGLSIYQDINMSSNYSTNAADQEGYLSGITNLVVKWAPGWALDRLHQGSFGMQTVTRPGGVGYDFVDRGGLTSQPLFAGSYVGGWAGPLGTALDGTSASALPGFYVGSQIGSLGWNGTQQVTIGCSVWCPTGSRSKFTFGQIISDYTREGLTIANPIGTGVTSLHIQSNAGDAYIDPNLVVSGYIREAVSNPPASSTAACAVGQRAWDANYEYRCVAANTWKRAALSAF
ncbi:hypothetical protein [Methylobacterium sp. J-076]|uniref:hypothetical protein n=1 Tax=Methylobacterium sp. J-076 TaxID=2836655 RepID=UPI001FB8F91D|nr:hypothetical protein [Methylobacterium sp. J-076]MCJ2015228.1 hypothetical protein [Methylobacterium sp. J-076]